MDEFLIYFQLGFEHITDPGGYDHILFLLALCAAYPLPFWKRVLILVTAFTIGHSLSLALAATGLVPVNSTLIEALIPVTIFITALFHLLRPEVEPDKTGMRTRYLLALGFGLIHGLGFSNFFAALMGGISEGLVLPLLSFNLGLEAGQILIVLAVLLLGFGLTRLKPLTHRIWTMAVSGLALILSVWLFIDVLMG